MNPVMKMNFNGTCMNSVYIFIMTKFVSINKMLKIIMNHLVLSISVMNVEFVYILTKIFLCTLNVKIDLMQLQHKKKFFTASFSLPKEKFSGKEGFKKINMIIPHECTIGMSRMDEDEDNKEDDAVIKNLIKMTDQEEMKKKTKKSEYIQRKTKQLHVNDT